MDPLTQAVQAQYEAYPYPLIGPEELLDVDPLVSHFDFVYYYCQHRQAPTQGIKILDAGCGTGFSTLKLAQANPSAEIWALDLSSASLEQARLRLEKAGVWGERIHLLQQDLQSAQDLGPFDYLHCTGVLHHLSDPARGFEVIRQLLAPDGLAYIMMYSPHARYYISQIQNILRQLWRDTSDLREGVMLCRSFFQGLPDSHPLKLVYYNHKTVIQQQFSAEFAQSDHFLIDTYLQQVEQHLDISQIFELLDRHDLHFLRFLDEAQWQPQELLPGLPDYLQRLSQREQWCLMDKLRLDRNYAFFIAAQALENRRTLRYQIHDIPRHAPALIQQEVHEHWVLDNQLGRQLNFEAPARFLWEQIDGQKTWDQILTICGEKYGFGTEETEEGLMPLLQGLIQNYFVLI